MIPPPFIPHSRPLLGPEEEQAALRVVRTGQLAQGPEVAALEEEVARGAGLAQAVALAHGTAALHLGLLALGAEPGRAVLVPAYGCASLLNAITLTGARPLLIDCRPGTPDPDLEAAAAQIQEDTAAALIPHLFGRPLGLGPLDRRVPVLGDATHAPGARWRGRPIARQGRATAWSFYATKMLCAGEGGVLASDRPGILRQARDLRAYDERFPWKLRFNYKMTELSAAILRVQHRRLGELLARRQALADFYRRELSGLSRARLLDPVPGEVPYRFVIRTAAAGPLVRQLRGQGIGAARPVFRPLHHFLGLPRRAFPHAEAAWRTLVSLPLYPGLGDLEAERVVRAARAALA